MIDLYSYNEYSEEEMSFAQRINRLGASPIRETLHLLDRPGMVSFAGGLPAEESFPALSLKQVP